LSEDRCAIVLETAVDLSELPPQICKETLSGQMMIERSIVAGSTPNILTSNGRIIGKCIEQTSFSKDVILICNYAVKLILLSKSCLENTLQRSSHNSHQQPSLSAPVDHKKVHFPFPKPQSPFKSF
jgi:hypothetical protein